MKQQLLKLNQSGQMAVEPLHTKREVDSSAAVAVTPVFASLNNAMLESLRAEIVADFSMRCEDLLNLDMPPMVVDMQDAYYARLLLPDEHRFMAALFDTIWKASQRQHIMVNKETMDMLLQQALQAVGELTERRPTGVIKCFLDQPENDFLRALVEAPDTFTSRASQTLEIFEKVAQDICECTGGKYEISPMDMWRLCIDPQTLAQLQERGIDCANPLLGFLFDAEPGYLHGMACGWEYVLKKVKEGGVLDEQFLVDLNAICSGACENEENKANHETDEAGAHYRLRAKKCQFSMLMGHTLTEEGESILHATVDELWQTYGVPIRLGDEEDAACTADFGRKVVTLTREVVEPSILLRVLNTYLARHRDEIDRIGSLKTEDTQSKQDMLALADIKLARCLNQMHIFSDGNIRTCHLLLNFLRLRRGLSPFIFYNPNILDGHSDQELLKAMKESPLG